MTHKLHRLLACACIPLAMAVEAAADSKGKHVHGVAEMAIVQDGASVSISLATPLVNVLGFEHAAETEGQRRIVREAAAALADPSSLVRLTAAARCTLTRAKVGDLAPTGASHDGHDHDHDADDAEHADLEADYAFTCAAPARLAAVEIVAFTRFPGVESVDVVYLGDGAQRAMRATPNNRTFKVR
jgi:hypothetical protein